MNNERQTLAGCIIWIGIIMVIGAGFRAKAVTQFFIMAAIIFFGLLVAIWALNLYSKGTFGNILLAFLYAYVAGSLLIAAGSFLWTGDYDTAIRRLWKPRATPVATAVIAPQSSPVPAQSTITAGATNPPSTSQNPPAGGTPEDGSSLKIRSLITEVWSRISADTNASKPISEQFTIWRLAIGAVLGLQYAAGFYVARYTRQRHVTRNFIFYGTLSALLMFTKLGEWIYSFFTLISGWGMWGYILIIIALVFIGLTGLIIAMMGFNNTIGYILIGTICTYIITSFMYHNIQMLQYCVLPSIVMMLIVLYIAIYQARYRRYLKFG
jgi:hypothetical protein